MATRPFAFGILLREKGRTVRVRKSASSSRYVVEDENRGKKRERKHASLGSAVKDAASTWRGRLH